MKLKAPIGCHAVSHGRRSIAMAEDGTIDADDEAALIFIAHGFRPIENGEDKQAVRSKADEPSRNTQTMSRSPVAESRDIEALSRKELFAFLKAKGIPVALPVTNLELRAAARRAGGG
jgi:hypothetical protein